MKLATYRDGSRDGQLVVVSQDLTQAHYATHIATRMQQVLDDWNFLSPQLEQLYQQLNQGKAPYPFPFEPEHCMSPLPRPADYFQSNAYARAIHKDTPLVTSNTSAATMTTPHAEIKPADIKHQADFSACLAAITDDIPRFTEPSSATESIRLLMLNANILTNSPFDEHNQQTPDCNPAHVLSAFSPVAVTCDELGDAWKNGKIQLRLDVFLNGQPIARCPADEHMAFTFGDICTHICQAHPITTGTIINSGPVMHADKTKGYTSISLKRQHELEETGEAKTPYLQPADTLRIEMKGKNGHTVFGALILKAQTASLTAQNT